MNEKTNTDNFDLVDLCEQAVSQWGYDSQMDLAIEEMSELIKAILKYRRKPGLERAMHIAEEVADVKIMTKQIDIIMMKINKNFNKWVEEETYIKLARLNNMLEEERKQP